MGELARGPRSHPRAAWFDFPRATTKAASLREGVLAFCGGMLLAVAMFWPLVLRLSRAVPKDAVDPSLIAWTVSWNGHAALHQPLSWWQANAMWPNHDALAFSDAFLGYTPLALLGGGFDGALLQYNVLFLLSYGLAFAGAYLLARELRLRPAAALITGVAFSYSAWRWAQSGHLAVLSSGGIPLSLMLLLRGYRRQRSRAVLAGWLVAGWQVLVGVTLGLQLVYVLAVLGLVAAVAWWRGERPRPEPAIVRATVAGALAFVVILAVVARPYLRVRDDYPESHRTLGQVAYFSPPPRAFLAAPEDNLLWGRVTASARRGLRSATEQTLFPGALTVGFAGLGLLAGTWSRRLRLGIACGLVLCVVLSLGTELLDGRFTYRLLYDHAPGWEGPRTPGRLHTLSTLLLSLLAGAGVHALATEIQAAASVRRRKSLPVGVCALVALIVLAEGTAIKIGRGGLKGPALASVMRPPAGLERATPPLLILPADGPTTTYMLWSVSGFPKIVNGYSGFIPIRTATIAAEAIGFPDRRSVRALRETGVRTVVLHRRLSPGTRWADSARHSIAGLGIKRHVYRDLVLFRL